jgi:hypothetical protein
MVNDIKAISKILFNKENINDVEVNAMEDIISRYPYFAPARYLLATKNQSEEALITAGLYINNPLRLHWLLNYKEPEILEAIAEKQTDQAEDKQPLQSSDESPIAFQSYHTIDYFASQGIRLQAAEMTKDKLGQQLKSFTDWLRSMKKLPTTESGGTLIQEDQNRHHLVVQSAAHSIEAKEILTEAMAEVWAKQGNREKAIAIYDKLSLQNPGKSGYFAARIDQLKVS